MNIAKSYKLLLIVKSNPKKACHFFIMAFLRIFLYCEDDVFMIK